jgi:hypothetical protein
MSLSGHKQKRLSLNGMSVLPPTADMRRLHRHVGFVPNAEVRAWTRLRYLLRNIHIRIPKWRLLLGRVVCREFNS